MVFDEEQNKGYFENDKLLRDDSFGSFDSLENIVSYDEPSENKTTARTQKDTSIDNPQDKGSIFKGFLKAFTKDSRSNIKTDITLALRLPSPPKPKHKPEKTRDGKINQGSSSQKKIELFDPSIRGLIHRSKKIGRKESNTSNLLEKCNIEAFTSNPLPPRPDDFEKEQVLMERNLTKRNTVHIVPRVSDLRQNLLMRAPDGGVTTFKIQRKFGRAPTLNLERRTNHDVILDSRATYGVDNKNNNILGKTSGRFKEIRTYNDLDIPDRDSEVLRPENAFLQRTFNNTNGLRSIGMKALAYNDDYSTYLEVNGKGLTPNGAPKPPKPPMNRKRDSSISRKGMRSNSRKRMTLNLTINSKRKQSITRNKPLKIDSFCDISGYDVVPPRMGFGVGFRDGDRKRSRTISQKKRSFE